MADKTKIVARLSIFNNRSFTKKQWDIVLGGCGCPKSVYFWNALKKNNLIKDTILFRLVDLNAETFEAVYEDYCNANKANNKRHKAKKKAQESARKVSRKTFFQRPDGSLSTEVPTDRD